MKYEIYNPFSEQGVTHKPVLYNEWYDENTTHQLSISLNKWLAHSCTALYDLFSFWSKFHMVVLIQCKKKVNHECLLVTVETLRGQCL